MAFLLSESPLPPPATLPAARYPSLLQPSSIGSSHLEREVEGTANQILDKRALIIFFFEKYIKFKKISEAFLQKFKFKIMVSYFKNLKLPFHLKSQLNSDS
jgi:hypothetical protein